MTSIYHSLDSMIEMIEPEQRKVIKQILEDNRDLFSVASGSSSNHQTWPGGYIDHVTECMNLAIQFYITLNACRELDFSLGEALVVMFLHDIEKPWRYRLDGSGKLETIPGMQGKPERAENRNTTIARYRLVLNARQLNAMQYVEGELDDYAPKRRMMWPLGAFCHLCDVWSARGWPNSPAAYSDTWPGAKRITDIQPSKVICSDCGSYADKRFRETRVGPVEYQVCQNSECHYSQE
ncbi:hypothetical protein H0W80_00965 [Candidatus Saccharibacteria bacterium]|nr:hypothetical protein [Candidatus Saccharibacteria bacterium]